METEELLTLQEVAQQYHVNEDTVRRWIRKGAIAYVMVGPYRLRRIPRAVADKNFVRVEVGSEPSV